MLRHLLLLPALALLLAGIWAGAEWYVCIPPGRQAQYVGREQCARCHEEQMRLWTGSDHDLAMDHARPDTVLGDFDDREFTHFGVTSKFFRRGEKFLVLTDGPSGALETFEVKYVFGVYPLQQYLVEFADGRVQCLPIAWDVPQRRWFHLYPGEKLAHDDVLHWTRPLQNWNYMCADCHSTNLQKNYELKTNTYHTAWSEIDVSCETCHGPGSIHVELADKKWFFWDRKAGMGLPQLKQKDHRVEVETCAPCHARRRVVHPGHMPGKPLLDHYVPSILDGNLYYADGQILDEDYEYGSFVQSKMYHKEVRCSDCHDPHSLRVKFAGTDPATGRPKIADNRLCGQCHLPSKYDTPQHHHHPDATKPGQLCVECHMPETYYMVVDPRRDHSLRVPRPELTVALGIPNACNGCHRDAAKGETPEWAAAKVVEWYGKKHEPPHFAHALAAGREFRPEAEKPLDALTRRQDLPAIVRASAVALLRSYPGGTAAAVRGLEDEDALVRTTAVHSLEGLPWQETLRLLRGRLNDPLRSVRVEAARLLSAVPADALNAEDRVALDKALAEYVAGLQFLEDQPGSHLCLGVLHANQGRLDAAEAAYRTALRLDPQFLPARVNLAMLQAQRGKPDEAIAEFRRIVAAAERQRAAAAEQAAELEPVRKQLAAAAPDSEAAGQLRVRLNAIEVRAQEVREMDQLMAESHYSQGLLMAEDGQRLAVAASELAEAVRLAPRAARFRYNYGLALQKLDRPDEAEAQLLKAYELAPHDTDFLYAIAVFYAQQKQWTKALACADELLRRDPENPDYRVLRARASREARGADAYFRGNSRPKK